MAGVTCLRVRVLGGVMAIGVRLGACLRAALTFVVATAAFALPPAAAGSIKDQLAKLDPEERAHQACVIKGLETIKHDKKLPGADRMKTSIFARATFSSNSVTTKGGAVKAHDHWYKLKFDCTVTPDQMKATAFTYEIGVEIPRDQWEDLGLW
jgi:predicted outer membrane repeat protein